MQKPLLLSLLLQMLPLQEPGWKLLKDKDKIQVYSQIANSTSVKAVKVTGVLEGSVGRLIEIFRDVNLEKEWVYSTNQARVLTRSSPDDLTYYVQSDLPWPVRNRDLAIRMRIVADKSGRSVNIYQKSEVGIFPVTDGIIRVPYFKGDWRVRQIDEKTLSISYISEIDPGGSLPAPIVNLFIAKGPYETFVRLAQLLKAGCRTCGASVHE